MRFLLVSAADELTTGLDTAAAGVFSEGAFFCVLVLSSLTFYLSSIGVS